MSIPRPQLQEPIGTTGEHNLPSRRRTLLIVSICLVLAAALVVGGRLLIGARAEAVDRPGLSPLIAVSLAPVVESVGYQQNSRHIGTVEPERQTELAFEVGGTLLQVMVQEGDHITKGQLVARLDTRTLQAQRRAQKASRDALLSDLERAQLTLERQKALQARDFAPGQSLDDARLLVTRTEALIEQADAQLAAIDVSLEKSVLRAPFNAQVGAQNVDEGSTVGSGAPVASLLENTAPLVRIGLPASQKNALERGTKYTVIINSVSYPASVLSTRSDLSTRTRTIDARLQLDISNRPLPVFGETAELILQQQVDQQGYIVPLDALTEGEAGLWSVLLSIPDEPGADAGTVVREHVEILHTDGVEAFVQGNFPADAEIIQAGLHRVVAGQRVRDVEASQ